MLFSLLRVGARFWESSPPLYFREITPLRLDSSSLAEQICFELIFNLSRNLPNFMIAGQMGNFVSKNRPQEQILHPLHFPMDSWPAAVVLAQTTFFIFVCMFRRKQREDKEQGWQIWHPNWVRLAPNETNLGLFKISFSTFWLD